MNKFKHTFAVLVYKESPYLEECLKSLFAQKEKSKIILCTSTYSQFIEKIAKKYKLEIFINKHSGIANDWNFALRQAKTPFVTLAHQDDIYLPEYTQEILKLMINQKDSLIGFSDYWEKVERANFSFIRKNSLNFFVKRMILFFNFFPFKKLLFSQKNKVNLLAFGSPIPCPSVMYNLKSIGDFSFDAQYKINMDWRAWYDLAHKKGSFIRSEKSLLTHRIHIDSATTAGIINNDRQNEDKKMFHLFWPREIVNILYKLYSLSYKNNEN